MPPDLTPPGSRQPGTQGSSRRISWIAFFSLVLLLTALAVVLILPALVVPVSEPPAPPAASSAEPHRQAEPRGRFDGGQTSGAVLPEGDTGPLQAPALSKGEAGPEQPAPQPMVEPPAGEDRQGADQDGYQAEAFRDAMGDTLGALDRQDLSAARMALERAELIDPGSSAVREARLQLAAASRAGALQALQGRAAMSEQNEAWQEAARLYEQALQLDPSALFAQAGSERVSRRLAIERAVDHYLRQPERLQADQPLANAKRLLAQLEGQRESGPGLRDRVSRLARLVAEAETLLPVRIHSDHATDVVVYPVGRLGRFGLRELNLRPGTYTVVGTREGFRDVRRVFTLVPGGEIEIMVRCEESI